MLSRSEAAEAIILALDCSADEALVVVDELRGKLVWAKVGMTLYYREGPAIVAALKERGLKVFLDLKLFDIPFQVEGAARSAASTGADLLSIHALGGPEMVACARRGVEAAGEDPATVIAITVLTSMDQGTLDAIGVASPVADEVERLASLALRSGAQGLVCSPREVARLRELLGPDALLVCPGVRPAASELGDQRRTATPAAALAAGASKLVIGRPIMAAADRAAAFDAIVDEIIAGV